MSAVTLRHLLKTENEIVNTRTYCNDSTLSTRAQHGSLIVSTYTHAIANGDHNNNNNNIMRSDNTYRVLNENNTAQFSIAFYINIPVIRCFVFELPDRLRL